MGRYSRYGKWIGGADSKVFGEIRDRADRIIMDTCLTDNLGVLDSIIPARSVSGLTRKKRHLRRGLEYMEWFNTAVLPHVESTEEVLDEIIGFQNILAKRFNFYVNGSDWNQFGEGGNTLDLLNKICGEVESQIHDLPITTREYHDDVVYDSISQTDVGLASLAIGAAADGEKVSVLTCDRDIVDAVALLIEFFDEDEARRINQNVRVHYAEGGVNPPFREMEVFEYVSQNRSHLRDCFEYGMAV